VLKDEQIRRAVAGEPNEGMIVVLDGAGDFLAIDQLHSHRSAVFNEALEIPDFLQCLFRRARPFSLLSRIRVSYLFFRIAWGSTETPPSCTEEAERLSDSP
jgi:hypothetical protein